MNYEIDLEELFKKNEEYLNAVKTSVLAMESLERSLVLDKGNGDLNYSLESLRVASGIIGYDMDLEGIGSVEVAIEEKEGLISKIIAKIKQVIKYVVKQLKKVWRWIVGLIKKFMGSEDEELAEKMKNARKNESGNKKLSRIEGEMNERWKRELYDTVGCLLPISKYYGSNEKFISLAPYNNYATSFMENPLQAYELYMSRIAEKIMPPNSDMRIDLIFKNLKLGFSDILTNTYDFAYKYFNSQPPFKDSASALLPWKGKIAVSLDMKLFSKKYVVSAPSKNWDKETTYTLSKLDWEEVKKIPWEPMQTINSLRAEDVDAVENALYQMETVVDNVETFIENAKPKKEAVYNPNNLPKEYDHMDARDSKRRYNSGLDADTLKLLNLIVTRTNFFSYHLSDLVATNIALKKVHVNWYKDLKSKAKDEILLDVFLDEYGDMDI